MKKLVSLLLVTTMIASVFVGCGSGEKKEAESSAPASEAAVSSAAEASEAEPAAADAGEATTIEFWYHDGNEVSNAYWNTIIENFEAAYPQYKVNYTGLPADSYLTKYTTAVATGTAPDVLDIRDVDVSTMTGLGCLTELTDIIAGFADADSYNQAGLDVTRSFAQDGGLYCLPLYATLNICWANSKALEEQGLAVPATQEELLANCESFADPSNNKYFFSLRGGSGCMENIFDFIFTYANVDHMFEEDGTCVFSQPIFAEALDKYASIYWNNWTSSDSLTNGFTEMVAEFGSETAMFIMHNSSSLGQHKANLGDGNFVNVKPLANGEGKCVTKALSAVGLSIVNSTEKQDAAAAFVEFAANAESDELICSSEGRVPMNEKVYESDWFKNDPYNAVYSDMTTDANVCWLTFPYWLSEFNDFSSSNVPAGWQAVLLKERTSADVLAEWSEILTTAQQNYLASQN